MSDGKWLAGKGRLIIVDNNSIYDKFINKMQNYYRRTIRQNTIITDQRQRKKPIQHEKKTVLTSFWYCTDIPDNQERHQFCPRESNNCCTYWQNGGSGNYKSNVNLPKVIKDLLVQIFLDLRDDNLSSRCLEQTTQNPKEAFNEITWKKCPKNIFVLRYVLEIGLASAINFNDGVMRLNRVSVIVWKICKRRGNRKRHEWNYENEQKDTRST